MDPPFMRWHQVKLIHSDLLRILHWAETNMDEEVTELIQNLTWKQMDVFLQGASVWKFQNIVELTTFLNS